VLCRYPRSSIVDPQSCSELAAVLLKLSSKNPPKTGRRLAGLGGLSLWRAGERLYEPAAPMAEPTLPNVALALVPRAVIAIRQTTMIKASMTAYSTAVGPSSFFRNSTTCFANRESMTFPFRERIHVIVNEIVVASVLPIKEGPERKFGRTKAFALGLERH
jgi:hypothetical protein